MLQVVFSAGLRVLTPRLYQDEVRARVVFPVVSERSVNVRRMLPIVLSTIRRMLIPCCFQDGVLAEVVSPVVFKTSENAPDWARACGVLFSFVSPANIPESFELRGNEYCQLSSWFPVKVVFGIVL